MSLHPPSYYILHSMPGLQTSLKVLDSETAETIRSAVFRRFTLHQNSPIWENLVYSASIQDPNGWRLLDDFLSNEAFILFFDADVDKQMIEFKPGSKIVPILEDCPGFEFYLTDLNTTYLLCYNHHDFLIGSGEAEQWVKSKTTG